MVSLNNLHQKHYNIICKLNSLDKLKNQIKYSKIIIKYNMNNIGSLETRLTWRYKSYQLCIILTLKIQAEYVCICVKEGHGGLSSSYVFTKILTLTYHRPHTSSKDSSSCITKEIGKITNNISLSKGNQVVSWFEKVVSTDKTEKS